MHAIVAILIKKKGFGRKITLDLSNEQCFFLQ